MYAGRHSGSISWEAGNLGAGLWPRTSILAGIQVHINLRQPGRGNRHAFLRGDRYPSPHQDRRGRQYQGHCIDPCALPGVWTPQTLRKSPRFAPHGRHRSLWSPPHRAMSQIRADRSARAPPPVAATRVEWRSSDRLRNSGTPDSRFRHRGCCPAASRALKT